MAVEIKTNANVVPPLPVVVTSEPAGKRKYRSIEDILRSSVTHHIRRANRARAARTKAASGQGQSQRQSMPAQSDLSCFIPDGPQGLYDQGEIGSCTANAACLAYKIMMSLPGVPACKKFNPSRLFWYWRERNLELEGNEVVTDTGADIDDGLCDAETTGIASEETWPYDESKVNVEPPRAAYINAATHTIVDPEALDSSDPNTLETNIKYAIAVQKRPVIIEINVHKSFETIGLGNGIIPLPKNPMSYDEKDPVDPFCGGHEVLIVGYDDSKRVFKIANSWGCETWGDQGFGYLPYDYVRNPYLAFGARTFGIPGTVTDPAFSSEQRQTQTQPMYPATATTTVTLVGLHKPGKLEPRLDVLSEAEIDELLAECLDDEKVCVHEDQGDDCDCLVM